MIEFLIAHWMISIFFVINLTLLVALELRLLGTAAHALSVDQMVQLANRASPLILDVRPEAAYKQKHVLSAKNFPETEWGNALKRWKKWQNKPVVLISDKGKACKKLMSLLLKEGFTQVQTLQGGFDAWQAAALPTDSGRRT